MKLNVKALPYCVACEFWDDAGRTAMSSTTSFNLWEVKDKEKRMCLKRRILTRAVGQCPKYKSKLNGL